VAAVGSRAPAGPSAHTQANADYLRDQAQAQAQLRKEQDQGLDKIGNTLDRLNEMAVTIDSELKEQDKILADIDTEMDSAQNKMDGAIKSVEKLLKTKDKCQLCVIAGLTVTFVIVAMIAICASCLFYARRLWRGAPVSAPTATPLPPFPFPPPSQTC
jgi:t-SNARE complex subunit (syntaxin)